MHCDLDDPEERKRLACLLRRGLGTITGFALPLRWQSPDAALPEGHWCSSQWEFRRAHMYLIPGSSAMGYRLPLDSLRWVPPHLRDTEFDRCQFAPRNPLPDPATAPLEPTHQVRQQAAAARRATQASVELETDPQLG